jgi:hypothetical protein
MGRVNEPHTSSDQLGDKQFELKGFIFSSLLDGLIHMYVLGKLSCPRENSLKITHKTCSKLCALRHLQ